MSHYTTRERDIEMPKLKAALCQFVSTHMDWIQSVASDYVKAKQVSLEVYLRKLCNLDGKLDELGIMIISRCFHVHTLILINGSYWTSRAENDYKKTVIKLAFCGEGIYKELCPISEEDTDDLNTVINKADVLRKGSDAKDLQGTGLVSDAKDLQGTGLVSDAKDLQGTGLVSESETAQPDDSGNESEGDEHYFVVNGVRYKGIQKDDCASEKQDILDLTNVTDDDFDSEEEEAISSSEDEGVEKDLWLPANIRRRRPASGKQPQPDVSTSVDPSNTAASQATTQVLLRRTNRKDPYVCFYCQESCVMLITFRTHMQTKHPNDKFPCENCSKTFESFNGLLKHQRSHKYLKWACDDCQYRCQFPGQLARHQKTHTKLQLVPCQVDDCNKKFTDKFSMKSHMKTHTTSLQCDLCPKDTEKRFNCEPSLSQHKRGQHGPGWTSYCGINYKWKSRYSRHIKKCTDCGKFRVQKRKERYLFL